MARAGPTADGTYSSFGCVGWSGVGAIGAIAGAATPAGVCHSSAARLGRASKKAAEDSDFLRRSPRASGGVRHGRPSKVRLHHSHAPDPPSRGRPRRAAEEWQTPAGVAAPSRVSRLAPLALASSSAQRHANRSAKSSREAGRTLTRRALLERPRSPDQGHASGDSKSRDGRRTPWPPANTGNAEEIPPRDFFDARSSSARRVSVLPASRLDFAPLRLTQCRRSDRRSRAAHQRPSGAAYLQNTTPAARRLRASAFPTAQRLRLRVLSRARN